jgi:type III restriction enzyme
MNRISREIGNTLSLRAPQRESLDILSSILEQIQFGGFVAPNPSRDVVRSLELIVAGFPKCQNFDRDFVSLCFALATGVGKTRLMGAFIAFLHRVYGVNNFFVLAPNLTIYNKLMTDFSADSSKYVLRGITEFAQHPPVLINGDNYAQTDWGSAGLFGRVRINIFNISKINSEVRGGKEPKIKRFQEVLGEGYFGYLSSLPDLVLLMDESHRYRASAGVRAINELRPALGIELTATPYVETARGAEPFRNVVFDYPLAKAMEDGFVKEPAVVTRRDFNASLLTTDEIERIKLEDGVHLHEQVRVELNTYARETGVVAVKPFMLLIARDTTHASSLRELIASDKFFNGRYADKVIQIDSSQSEELMIERLLKIEQATEPTEIVIHVNMLKEGWDVTNLYTIVPLRAASARILIEQSIGRGLRLPYGKRTGVMAVDRLNIVAHDKFQEILDEAGKTSSLIRLQQVILENPSTREQMQTVQAVPMIEELFRTPEPEVLPTDSSSDAVLLEVTPRAFADAFEQRIAQEAYRAMQRVGQQSGANAVTTAALLEPSVQQKIISEVQKRLAPSQMPLEFSSDQNNSQASIAAIVAQTATVVVERTISIPRILTYPIGEVRVDFLDFELDFSSFEFIEPSAELVVQHLRTSLVERIGFARGGIAEKRPEDYLVFALMELHDVDYFTQADVLYALSSQVVRFFLESGRVDADIRDILVVNQKPIARFMHKQMQQHKNIAQTEYETRVSQGFVPLKQSAYTALATDQVMPLSYMPNTKSEIPKIIYGHFERCLYRVNKFQSNGERILAMILENDSLKWFRPARGQFFIRYRDGEDQREYQPDFVAELEDEIVMLEVKSENEVSDAIVLEKARAAKAWCANASQHALEHGGKPWMYANPILDTEINVAMSLGSLMRYE